jgi:hypothetical protein
MTLLVQLPGFSGPIGRLKADRLEVIQRFDKDGQKLALVEIVLDDVVLRDAQEVLAIDPFDP